jgi:hypothetical protein
MSRGTPQLHPYIALRIMQDILHNGSGSVRFPQDFPPSLNLWHDLQRKCGLTRGLSSCCQVGNEHPATALEGAVGSLDGLKISELWKVLNRVTIWVS